MHRYDHIWKRDDRIRKLDNHIRKWDHIWQLESRVVQAASGDNCPRIASCTFLVTKRVVFTGEQSIVHKMYLVAVIIKVELIQVEMLICLTNAHDIITIEMRRCAGRETKSIFPRKTWISSITRELRHV